jgi:hypothetical protein
MNFRIYWGDDHSFTDMYKQKLALRLECFNSVDGSARLVILFGWLRFVCSNGLVIGETKIEIKERHGQNLDLASIAERIRPALEAVSADRFGMMKWQSAPIDMEGVALWADGNLSNKWGKKAAARVFHICDSGKDIEFEDPFEAGHATQKRVRYLERVPGCEAKAKTKYDVCQALSFVATRRNNAEERVGWQSDIPSLLDVLPAAT